MPEPFSYELPSNLQINIGAEFHHENMAKFSQLLNAKSYVEGTLPGDDPDVPQDELQQFGNWTGQTDVRVMAQDLQRRGLIGAQQLIDNPPDLNDPDSIRNAQPDWKSSAIQQILQNAKKLGLRTKEEVRANMDVLISNPKWREGINNPAFKAIHPNFLDVITDSILPEQYAKFDKIKRTDLAKK